MINNLVTILGKKDIDSNLVLTLKKLFDEYDAAKQEQPWQAFGYKYLGPINHVFSIWAKNKGQNETASLFIEFVSAHGLEPFIANSGYVRKILSILLAPVEKNRQIITDLKIGIKDFVADIKQKNLEYEISEEIIKGIFEYFSTSISKYDEMLLWQAVYEIKRNEEIQYVPIGRHDKFTIGIINPWPGDMHAESEVLKRFDKGLEDLDMECVFLDNFGHVLEKTTQKKTEVVVDPSILDFVITTHYETHKAIDTFYYHTVWNPPEIPLKLSYYAGRATNHYIMNDDYLIYDSGGMKNHLKTILINSPRDLEGASELVASFPTSSMLEPKLDNPCMFYCGMNWEVLFGGNRHAGLFRLLDDSGCAKFFGPEKVAAWGGVKPWAGYKSYQHSIPFDGFSILKEINECGICLVLSSDIHRRAGAVSNRAYEACAAGAVIISDNNEFMQKHFRDAALFINYNKENPEDTFKQLMEKYYWIITHKKEALEIAKKAQAIFRNRFSLDKEVPAIIKNHAARFNAVKNVLFAKDESKKVLVGYVLETVDEAEVEKLLEKVINNCNSQYYRNIVLGIACDNTIVDLVKKYCNKNIADVVILPMKLFDEKKSRVMTKGQAILKVQSSINHDYFMSTNKSERWFYDHITTLVRTLGDTGALCAYSGSLSIGIDGYSRTNHFGTFSLADIFVFNSALYDLPGKFLFKKEVEKIIPDFVFDNVDGLEHYLYLAYLKIKLEKEVSFSRRMTIAKDEKDTKDIKYVLPIKMQINLIKDIVRFEYNESYGYTYLVNKVNQVNKDLGIVRSTKKTIMYQCLKRLYHLLGFAKKKK